MAFIGATDTGLALRLETSLFIINILVMNF